MEEIVLEAEKRVRTTKSVVNVLRRTGRVPGVAYGDGEPMALSVDAKSLMVVLKSERGRNALINLKIDGGSHAVLLKEIQRDPISRAVRHVDFHRISLKKKIEAAVPVHVKGEAPGVKLSGGILEHVVRDVRVRCLPADIPGSIDVDVSNLQIGQAIKGRDLPLPQGVELVTGLDGVIIHVVAPQKIEEPTPAAGVAGAAATATAEPEVIKKGKTDEAAEGAAAPAGDKKTAAPAKTEAKK